MTVKRRRFLKVAMLFSAILYAGETVFAFSRRTLTIFKNLKRVRPQDPLWPSPEKWNLLNQEVKGSLLKLKSPFAICNETPESNACNLLFQGLKNPYYIGDNPALTQTSGWLDAWRSESSAYAVSAKSTADVVAAVNFARNNNLRLVVKGGGHSYQGTSNAADSLLIWTRSMHEIVLLDDFVGLGCAGIQAPQQAVTIGAGAIWLHVYDAVMTKAGRYVQGGGCLTVGVAGLIQSGGFGSLSKYYGLAAAALLEAEIVLADGSVQIVNNCAHPDLFWALKGGGGGSFGVVTRLTLKTRALPQNFGAVVCSVRANSDKDFKILIEKLVKFYTDQLFNPQWGEQISFYTNHSININMIFHGLSAQEAEAIWQPFVQAIKDLPEQYQFITPFQVIIAPARHLWDASALKKFAPGVIQTDDRPNAPEDNIYWKSNADESGQFLYGYHSAWMPESLLKNGNQSKLVEALYSSSRHWTVSLHFNKGLAGSFPEEIEAAKTTAINPDALSAFALAIIAGQGEPAFLEVKGHEPEITEARLGAKKIQQAMDELMKAAPGAGSYVSESNYFERNWQQSFWGTNYEKLAQVKKKYDPEGLFFVHHGVGSEEWSADGFTRI